MTANAFTSVSLDPPLILVSIDKKADMHDWPDGLGCLLRQHPAGAPPCLVRLVGPARRPRTAISSPIYPTARRRPAARCWTDVSASLIARSGRATRAATTPLFVGEVQEAAVSEDESLRPLLFFASKYGKLQAEEG